MSIISIKNLKKEYTYTKKSAGFRASLASFFHRETLTKVAVDTMNLEIQEGELVALLGPNGAGKTTTIKMLAGILYPTSGTMSVMGYNPMQRERKYLRQIAIVMGNKNQLWWDLPATDTFELNKSIYDVPDAEYKKNLNELIELLDLKDIIHVPVRKLSLGQRMKCELVASLLHQPRILFLDEPTLGLDVDAQKNMRQFIKEYNTQRKTTILLTSHYMADIEALAQRVLVLNRGKILYDGALHELMRKYEPEKYIHLTFEDSFSPSEFTMFGELQDIAERSLTIKVKREKVKEVAAKILAMPMNYDDISIEEAKVEDVIQKVFHQQNKS